MNKHNLLKVPGLTLTGPECSLQVEDAGEGGGGISWKVKLAEFTPFESFKLVFKFEHDPDAIWLLVDATNAWGQVSKCWDKSIDITGTFICPSFE